MFNWTNIDLWTQLFGLYPILLNPQDKDNKYLMLNGGSKDFCLQMNNNNNQDIYFSDSWSSNTKNFVTITEEIIFIYNWYNNKKTEQYLLKNVGTGFYNYLSSKSYKTQNDVVPFIINVFRRLRNMTGKKDPVEALNLLFKLLISINEESFDTNLWGIKDAPISSANFESFVDQIRKGVNDIKPNLDLILRHTAGALFQEAQKEIIYFDNQMDLFDVFSSKLKTKNNIYSSVHYTPQYLSRSIVENCLKQIDLNKTELKIFDPACGSSEFLIETLKQLHKQSYKGKIKIIGWDSSESAVCTSNFLLKYEQRTQWKNDQLEFEIKQVTDSLTEHWDSDYDLILMNPPYISWELLTDKSSKDAIMETLGTAFKTGKPNQASAFFYKATKSLSQNGVLGCIIPTSILTSDSYSKIRNEINEEFTINLLAKLGNYVFESALTDVSFFVGKKNKSNILPELIWTKNEKGVAQDVLCDLRKKEFSNSPAVENKSYSIYTPSTYPIITDSWKVISLKEERFLKDVQQYETEKILVKVSDVFNVKQGIRTGNNNVFIISIEEYESLPNNEKQYYRKAINNDTVKNGIFTLTNYVWYPYDSKGIIFNNETEFQQSAPVSYKKMSQFKDKLSNDRARKDINSWWHLSEHRAWLRDKDKRLYSTEFGKSDSFAFDKEGNFVVERGCAWIPKKAITLDDYYLYLAVFSSNIFDFLLSIYSKPIMSGYYLGKVYVQDIPIPNISLSEIKNSYTYQRLVELGKELANGNSYVKYAIDDTLEFFYPKIN